MLKQSPQIKSLNLEGLEIFNMKPEMFEYFITSHLTDLGLQGIFNRNPPNSFNIPKLIINNKTLTELNLFGLEYLQSETILALQSNTTLTNLNLGCNNLQPNHYQLLAIILRTNKTLLRLSLAYNQSEGIENVFEALEVNTALTKLNLHKKSSLPIPELSRLLRTNKALKILNLSETYLKDITELAASIAENKTLTQLDLSFNDKMTNFQKIIQNKSITSLDLSATYICGKDPDFLGNLLTENNSLTELNFQANMGGAQLYDIKMNQIMNGLVEGLSKNTSLTKLDLGDNSLSSENQSRILKAISGSLTWLNLCNDNSSINPEIVAEFLKTNTTLKYLEVEYYRYCSQERNRPTYQT